MAAIKRNEWLEADLEDEENAVTSEEEESRHNALKSSRKRLKTSHSFKSDSDSDLDNETEDIKDAKVVKDEADPPSKVAATQPITQDTKKRFRGMHRKSDEASRSGVIYLSRVPPFMKPQTLRTLLEPCASSGLGRIFLTPEPNERRKARIRSGGNKKHTFVDGWVEFLRKSEAKDAVLMLNTRTIGGKKGGYYRDDVWSLRYLKGFKWADLMEQVRTEDAERDARLRAEGTQTRRELREFMGNVEKGKMEDTRRGKRKAKGELGEEQVFMNDQDNDHNDQ